MTHDTTIHDGQNENGNGDGGRLVRTFASADEVAEAGAERFVQIVQETLEKNERCSVVLGGGTTFLKMYALLAQRHDLDWKKIHLFIGDERFVPYDNPQSNWGTMRKVFMDHIDIPNENLHPVCTEGVGLEEAAKEYEVDIIDFFSQVRGDVHEGRVYPLLSPQGRGVGGKGEFSEVLLERARKMRKSPTEAENKMWNLLRNRGVLGAKFKRQHPCGPYILDFVCLERRLVVEVDGSQHADSLHEESDAERSTFLASHGFHVLRFWNNEVLENPEGVWEVIAAALEGPSPSPLPEGERGIPTTFDLVLLGIGPDGHTLSIFPGSEETKHPSNRLVIAVHDSPKPPAERISLTYKAVNQAKHILFLVSGVEKKEALEGILHGPEDRVKWPAQGVRPEEGRLWWFNVNL